MHYDIIPVLPNYNLINYVYNYCNIKLIKYDVCSVLYLHLQISCYCALMLYSYTNLISLTAFMQCDM